MPAEAAKVSCSLSANVKLFTKAAVFPWSRSGPGRVLVRLRPGRGAIGGAIGGAIIRSCGDAIVRWPPSVVEQTNSC